MKVILFKLTNGDEVISTLVDETDTHILISKPRKLSIQATGPGQMGVAMIPWFMGAPDETFDVDKNMICTRASVVPGDLERGYTSSTSVIDLLGA